jgi:hypothetical protein
MRRGKVKVFLSERSLELLRQRRADPLTPEQMKEARRHTKILERQLSAFRQSARDGAAIVDLISRVPATY